MNSLEVREPKQKRSIIKKEKIVDAGWKLISLNGYHNTNTAEIAKEAGVSTGIVYQYFKDKHDILIAGLDKFGDDIFFPKINVDFKLNKNNVREIFDNIITNYINNHKVSQEAHEEIMAMVHVDHEVAKYYYKKEMDLTYQFSILLKDFSIDNCNEIAHVLVGLIDNLCHEVAFHKHSELNYESMKNIVLDIICNILK